MRERNRVFKWFYRMREEMMACEGSEQRMPQVECEVGRLLRHAALVLRGHFLRLPSGFPLGRSHWALDGIPTGNSLGKAPDVTG